jgi:hypothetical protein
LYNYYVVLDKLHKNVLELARSGLRRAAQRTQERLRQNSGLVDHTIAQLKAAGHPYSRRFPQPDFHSPEYLVHRQTGRLQDHIKITEEGKDAMAIGVDPSAVPYFLDVVEGNSLMVPRDFPFFTLEELKDEKIISDTMDSAIKEAVDRS